VTSALTPGSLSSKKQLLDAFSTSLPLP